MNTDDLTKWYVWPDDTYCTDDELEEMNHMSDDYFVVMASGDEPPTYDEIAAARMKGDVP